MSIGTGLKWSAIVVSIGVASHWVGQQAYTWLPNQAVAETQVVDDLFSFLVTIATAIFLGVIGTLLYSVITGRVARGDLSDGLVISGNVKLETAWTAIPILLVIWIAIYSFRVYQQMGILDGLHSHGSIDATPNLNAKASAVIDVRAKQWAWSFHYPDRDVTSTELHLPVNQSARLVLHSEDVLHGFYVPDFRIKQDIIPGRTIQLQFTPIRTGKYRLNDSQFSGTYFAVMQAAVSVDSPETYQHWLDQAATRQPKAAPNQAVSEHHEQPEKVIQSGWKAIPPAAPPVVNHPN